MSLLYHSVLSGVALSWFWFFCNFCTLALYVALCWSSVTCSTMILEEGCFVSLCAGPLRMVEMAVKLLDLTWDLNKPCVSLRNRWLVTNSEIFRWFQHWSHEGRMFAGMTLRGRFLNLFTPFAVSVTAETWLLFQLLFDFRQRRINTSGSEQHVSCQTRACWLL